MTVSSTTSSQTFACDGATTVFIAPFRVLEASAVRGYLITIASGAVAELVNGTDFTVSRVGEENTYCTTATAYSSAYQVRFKRVTARLQETDYRDNDPFPAESHEAGLDRLMMISQEDGAAIERTIRVPEGESLAELPTAAARASKVVGFTSTGALTALAPTDGSAASLALTLASDSLTTEGAGAIGIDESLAYPFGTVGWALIRRSFNARARGALGDGVNNDATVINTGLAAGRWVELDTPSAYYKVDSALDVPQRGGIIGESAHATIIRRSGGSGSVIRFDGSSGDGGPYLLRNLRLGGSGCTGITEKAGGYTNYIARLRMQDVFTEADLVKGIDANLIYLMADGWRDGYYQESGVHASHQALVASSGGPLATNVNTLRNCYFGFSPASYAMTISGGVQWAFEQCDWSVNKRNLYAVNISSLRLIHTYTEGGNPVTGSLFVLDPTTRATAIFDGGTYDGGAMAAGCAIFGFASTAKARVMNADIITSASAFAYLNTTTLSNTPTSGHHFEDNSYAGNTSDPLYPFSGVRPGTAVAWTPVPNGLTLAGAPGTATYTGFWSIIGRTVTVGIRIVPAGTSTTAATAATTFFTLPTGIPAPAYNTAGAVANEVLGDVGACFAYSNGRVYMPGWAAQQNSILITVSYPI